MVKANDITRRYVPTRRVAEPWLRAGRAVPLARRLPLKEAAPRPSGQRGPVGVPAVALCERLQGGAYPFFLDSARAHPVTGRCSFLGCDPSILVRATRRQVLVGPPGRLTAVEAHPLELLRALLEAGAMVTIGGFPPFVGGAVGVVGYDAARLWEPLASGPGKPRPTQAQDDLPLPEVCFGLYETIVAVDHAQDAAWVITRLDPRAGVTRAYDEAVARIDAMVDRLSASPESHEGEPVPGRTVPGPVVSTHTRASFERMVRQAQRWIAAGDIYQVNLSQRLQTASVGSAWDLYQRLRAVNPSPFAGYLDAGDVQLVCASPERLVRLCGGVVDTRPIAGTRPRTGQPWPDRRERQTLMSHPKERAEHLMLVDLARNDLGRVCAYGSVAVNEFMALEAYSHVFHLVSNVRGRLADGCDWLDVVVAMLPGGTITGCPKIRSMQIIEALEPVRRQLYTGSLGYLSFTGAMDLNLVIRSAVVTEKSVYVQAGAGIVADSDPGREYEETLHKAEALLVALSGMPIPATARWPAAEGADRAVMVG